MKRSPFLLVLLTGFLEVLACSPNYSQYRYDTLEAGAVRLVRVGTSENPPARLDTIGVYRPVDLEARLRGFLKDSALAFIGRFDSVSLDSVAPGPFFVMDSTPYMRNYTVYLRLQVDTVLRGVFPLSRPVWLRLREGAGSCLVPFVDYLNRPFLNASTGFAARADLKFQFSPFGYVLDSWYSPFPTASWFTGRYLYDPAFPKVMRVDITTLIPGYPATGIAPRRAPGRAFKAAPDKAWLPDGRVRGADAGKSPMPVLR